MKTALHLLANLSDQQLLDEVQRLAAAERGATAMLVQSLMVLDTRRLYLGEGFPSLFVYCTQALHLSEHAAYNRIEVARAAKRVPELIDALSKGDLNLTGARLIAPHLTPENCDRVLMAARHKNKRAVEEIVASLNPQPDAQSSIRKLPSERSAPVTSCAGSTPALPRSSDGLGTDADPRSDTVVEPALSSKDSSQAQMQREIASSPRPVIAPTAPARYKVQFTIDQDTFDMLRQVKHLVWHTNPNGDLAPIFKRALALLLAELQRTRLAAVDSPQPSGGSSAHSRHIPAEVKRAVWKRDGGQCAFLGSRGRCRERGSLEWHHVTPFARGGTATVDNIQLRCRAHNQYEADLFFDCSPASCVRERAGDWGTGTAGLELVPGTSSPPMASRNS